MLGILFALIAAIAVGIENLLMRHVLKTEDTLGFTFLVHLISTILLIPLFAIEFALPSQPIAWLFAIASALIWLAAAYCGFLSYKTIDASTKSPITKIKLFFVLLLSVILLGESLTAEKVIGTALIFAGITLLTYKGNGFARLGEKGIQLIFLAALLTAIAQIIDKYAINYFTSGTYGFLVYLFAALALIPFVAGKMREIKTMFFRQAVPIIAVTAFGAGAYYLILQAFKVAEASVIVPIIELSTLIIVFGGIVFLKEEKTVEKIAAAIIAILGAVLITGIYKIF